jgi:DNA invertase Pin-like site-specific DNA recombinase
VQAGLAKAKWLAYTERPTYFAKATKRTTVLSDEDTALLREIRDLLIPIADHYREEYEERQAAKFKAKRAKVKDLLSTPTRRKAWQLADGTRAQREISKQAALDEGATSKLFKQLRELGAVDGTSPKRIMEVD